MYNTVNWLSLKCPDVSSGGRVMKTSYPNNCKVPSNAWRCNIVSSFNYVLDSHVILFVNTAWSLITADTQYRVENNMILLFSCHR